MKKLPSHSTPGRSRPRHVNYGPLGLPEPANLDPYYNQQRQELTTNVPVSEQEPVPDDETHPRALPPSLLERN